MASSFPLLKTGAVAQYPLTVCQSYETRVLRYFDGSEQRFIYREHPTTSWVIDLSRLDEGELATLDLFFRSLQGSTQYFTFVDPATGTPYDHCRIDQAELTISLDAVGLGGTSVRIVQDSKP